MGKKNKKAEVVIFAVLGIVAFLMANIFAQLYLSRKDPLRGFDYATDAFMQTFLANPFALSLEPYPLLAGLIGTFVVFLIAVYMLAEKRNRRDGEEQGSARWATKKEIQSFTNKKSPSDNILITENVHLSTQRGQSPNEVANLNVLVVGGSGSGKTRSYVKPNLMQLNASYFVTDPKGTCILETGQMLEDAGYAVKTFDTINFRGYYNPFQYVKTDADILSFVECLISNTTGEKAHESDPFWSKAERLFYTACIALLRDYFPEEDYTLPGLLKLLDLAYAKEEDEDFKSPLDKIFDELERGRREVERELKMPKSRVIRREIRQAEQGLVWVESDLVRNADGLEIGKVGGVDPQDDFALSNYRAFKTAAGKTLKSILISCNARLKPLSIKEVNQMLQGMPDENGEPTGKCGLELDKLCAPNSKDAIFAVMSDTDKTFAFLHAMVMNQTINVLCNRALIEYGGSLKVPMHFIFDEFANIGVLPNFQEVIAVTRSRNIWVSVILQSLSQLEAAYNKSSKTIIDCCATLLFLGGKSDETNESLSKMLGKQTIMTTTYSSSNNGQTGSTSKNNQIVQRDLMTASEISQMPSKKALVLIANNPPIMDAKTRIERHKNYELIDPGHPGAKYDQFYDITKKYKG